MIEENPFDFYTPEENQDASVETIPTEVSPVEEQPAPEQGTPVETPPEQAPQVEPTPEKIPGMTELSEDRSLTIYNRLYPDDTDNKGFEEWKNGITSPRQFVKVYGDVVKSGLFEGSVDAFQKWIEGKDTSGIAPINKEEAFFRENLAEVPVSLEDQEKRKEQERVLDINKRIEDRDSNLTKQRIEEQNSMVGAGYSDRELINRKYSGLRTSAINDALVYAPESLDYKGGGIEDITPEQLTKLKSGSTYEDMLDLSKRASKRTFVSTMFAMARGIVPAAIKQVIGQGGSFINRGKELYDVSKQTAEAMPEILEGNAKAAAYDDYLSLSAQRINFLWNKITEKYPDAEEKLNTLQELSKDGWTPEDQKVAVEMGLQEWQMKFFNDDIVDKHKKAVDAYNNVQGEFKKLNEDFPARAAIMELKRTNQAEYDAIYRSLPMYQQVILNTVEKLSTFAEKGWELVTDSPVALGALFGLTETQLAVAGQMDDLMTVDPTPSNMQRDIYEQVGLYKEGDKEYQVIVDDEGNVSGVRDKEGYPVGFLTQESFERFVSGFKASETPVNEQFNGWAFTSVLFTTGVDFAMTLALMQARGLSGIKGFNRALSSERMVSLLVPTFQYFAPMALQEVKGGATPQMASVKGFIGSLTEGLTEALNPMEARIARGMKLNKAAVTRMMRLDIPSWEKAIGVMADGSKQFVMELGEEVAANGMNSMVNDIAYENVGMLQFADDRGWKKFEKEFKPTFWLTLGLMGPVAIHHTRQSWFDAGSDGLYQQYVYNAVEDPARFMAISEEVRKQLGTGVINRTSGENKGFTPQEAAEKSIVIDREQQIVKELSDEYATVMQDGEIAETDKVRIVSNAHSLKQSEEVVDKLPEGVLKEKAQERLEKLKENHNTFLKEVLDNKGKPKNKKTYIPPADKEVEVLEDKPYFTKEEVGDKLEKVNTTTSSGGEEVNVLLDEYGNQYYEVPHNDGTVIIDAEKFQEWSKVDRQMSDALENATTEEEIDATRERAFENKRMVIGDVTAEEIAEINEANSFKEGNTVTFEDGQTAEVISVKKRGRGISEVVLQTDKGKVTLNNAKQVKAAVGKLRKYAPVNSKGINKQGLSDNVTENVSRINGITGSDEVSTSRKDNIVKHVDKKLDERNFDKTKEKAKRLQDNGVIASSGRIGDTAVVVGADGISYGNTAEGWKPIESVGVGNSIVYGNKSTPTLEILNRELSYNQDTDAILSNEVLASRHFASSQDLSETPHSTTAANNDAANKYIMSLPIIHEEDGHTLYQGDGVVYVVDANGKVLPSNEAIDVMDGFGQSFLPPEVEQVMEDAMSDSANSDQVLRDLAELLGDSFPGPWVFDSSHSDTSVLGKRLPKSLHKKIKNVIMAFTNVMPNIKIVVKTNATWNRQDAAYFNRHTEEIHINADTINDKIFAHEVIHPILLAIMHHTPEIYTSMENDIYDAFLKGDIPSLNAFMESYEGKNDATKRHEALTEFFAKVVEGHIVLEGKDVAGLNKAIKAIVTFINDVLGIDLGNVFNLDDISSSADIVHTVNLIRDVLDGNVIMTANERINGKESTFDEFGDMIHRSNLTKEGKGVLDDIFAMFSNSPNRFGSFDTFRGRVAELMSTPNPVTPYRRNYTREEAIEEVIKNPSKPDIEKIISFGQFASEVRKSELDAELSSIIGDKGIRWMDPAIYKNINKWGEYRGSKSAVLQNAIYVDTGRIKVGETMRLEDMISSKGNSTIPTIFSVYPWLRNVNVTFKDIPYKGSIVGGMTSHTDIVDSILGDYVLSGGVIGNETEKFINLVDEAFRSRKGFDEFNKVFSVIPGFTENYLFDKMDEFAANTDMELSQTYITNPDLAEYSQADLVNTIFHEVQHLIQDYEEWPQGGNVGSILRSINDTPFSRVYNTSFSSVDAISDIVNLSDYSGILKTTVYDGNTYQTYVIEVPENNAGRIALVKEFRAARLSAMADNLKAHDTKKQELVKLAGFNTSNVKGLTLEDIATALYYNLEGEVQANAAGRLSESYPDNYVVSPYVAKISKSITKEELASSVDKIQNDFNSNVAKAVEPMLDVLGKYSTEYSPALADSPFAVYKDNLGKAYALPEESVVRNELYPAGFDAATANQARAWEDTEQVDTELSSIPQDDDTVNKILAKINEETNPAKKEVLIEAASIGLGIPADELRTRAREFSGTSKVRRQIAKAVNAMSPYSGTYPGVTINAITNSVVKKLREDGVTEEEFPDSSVKEMVSEAVLARHNTRPEVGKNEQRFLRKIAKEVTPDNNVMAVVAKHRKNYRNNYKAELPWQYVDDLSKGIDPFKKKAKSSKTAKRDGLSDNVRDMLTSIPVEERSVSEQARLRDVIWDQFLANSEGNELEAAKAILSSFHLIPDLSTRIAILKKIAGVAEIYGDVFFIRDTKQALLLSTTSAGRALYEARGNEGLGESLVDKFFEEMDSRTMAVLEEQIGDKKVADILRELVGITSIVPKSRAEIEKMMRDLITSLSSGLSSALSQKLFYTIDDLLTPAEKALSKDARQMVIRDKLVAAAKSYHYRAGKNVLDKTGYDKIIDAYVRKTLGSKINRPYDIREALKPFIADLNGQDWLAKVVSSIRDSATNLEATSATPNDKALASAYGDHIINQITSDDPALLNQAIDNIDPVLEKAIVDALVNMKSASLLNNQVLSYLMMNVPGITLYKAKLVANFMKSNFAVTLTVKEKADLRNKINAVVGKANKNLAEDIYRAFASGDVSEMDVLALLANHLGVTAITAAERVEYGVLLQDIMSARNAKELARAYKNLSMFTDRLESEHGVDSQKSLNDFLDRMIGHGYNSMLSGWQTWQRAAVSGVLEEMFNVIYDLFSGVTTFGNVYLSRIAMRGVREMLSGGGLSVAEKIVYAADALHKIVVKNDPIDYKFHRDWNINSNALEVKRQKLKDNWREVFKYVFGLMKGNFTSPTDLINAMKTTRIPFVPQGWSKWKAGQAAMTVFDMFMYPFLKPLVVGTRMITWVDAVYTSVFADYENAIHELQRDLGTNGGNAPLTNLIAARKLRNAQLKAEIAAEVKAEGLKGTAAIRRKQELWLGMMETEAFKRTMHNLEVASMATYATGLPGQASLFIDRLSSGDTVGSKTMKILSMLLTPFTKVLGGSISRMYKATPIIGLSLEYTFQALHGKLGDVRNKIPSQVLDYNPDTGKHEWRDNTRLEAVRMHTRGIAAIATLLGLLSYLFDLDDDDDNSVTRIVPNKEAMFRITGPGTTSFANDKNVDRDYEKNAIQVKHNGRWVTIIDYSIVPTLGPVCAFLGMLYDRYALVSDPFVKGYIVQRHVYNNGSRIDSQYDVDFADMSKKLMYAMGHIMFESSVAQSARHVTDMFELITGENGKKTELTNEAELARVQGKSARVWGNAISQYTTPSLYKQALNLYRDETQTPMPDYPAGSVTKRIIEKNMRDVLGLNILANSIFGEGRVLKDVFGVPIIPEQDFFVVGNVKETYEVPGDWQQRSYGEYLLRRKALDPLYDFIHSRTDINELGRYYPKADIEGGIETIPADLIDEISDVAAIRMGYKLMEPEELEKIKEMTSAEVEDYFNKKLKKKVGDEAKSIVFLRYLNAIDPTVMEYEEGYPMKFEGVKAILENLGFDLTDEEMEAKSPTGIRFFPDGGATTSKKNQDYLREKHPALYKWFFIDRKKMRDAIPFASDLDLLDWATFTDDDKARRKMLYEKYSQINSR